MISVVVFLGNDDGLGGVVASFFIKLLYEVDDAAAGMVGKPREVVLRIGNVDL